MYGYGANRLPAEGWHPCAKMGVEEGRTGRAGGDGEGDGQLEMVKNLSMRCFLWSSIG